MKEGLETRYKRILRLEEERNGVEIELTEEQIRLLEKANPSFRERHVESPHAGYLLSQDRFMVGALKGVGRVYLQAVVDTYSSFGFAKLYTSKVLKRPWIFCMTGCCRSTKSMGPWWSTFLLTTGESTAVSR